MNFLVRVCTIVLFLSLFCWISVYANPAPASPILPTWKLLTGDQKRQFIAGYQQGLRDSEQITGVALEFVEQNPNEAVSALKRVRSLYQAPNVAPEHLVKGLDRYLSDPDNIHATLSSAINAVVTAPQNPYEGR